jgi:hypothetical protein
MMIFALFPSRRRRQQAAVLDTVPMYSNSCRRAAAYLLRAREPQGRTDTVGMPLPCVA